MLREMRAPAPAANENQLRKFAAKPATLRVAFYEWHLSVESLRRDRRCSWCALIAALTSPASLQWAHYDETPRHSAPSHHSIPGGLGKWRTAPGISCSGGVGGAVEDDEE